jgi:hypothetical protein
VSKNKFHISKKSLHFNNKKNDCLIKAFLAVDGLPRFLTCCD